MPNFINPHHPAHRLFTRISPTASWKDLRLPPAIHAHLADICTRVKEEPRQEERVLMCGPQGRLIRAVAAGVAFELDTSLYSLDLSAVTSKYIKETEENLDAFFARAAESEGVLFFDEADGLFGTRDEVRKPRARSIEPGTRLFLHCMELFTGLVIVSARRCHIDPAYTRRFHTVVEFPLPANDARERIWEWPPD